MDAWKNTLASLFPIGTEFVDLVHGRTCEVIGSQIKFYESNNTYYIPVRAKGYNEMGTARIARHHTVARRTCIKEGDFVILSEDGYAIIKGEINDGLRDKSMKVIEIDTTFSNPFPYRIQPTDTDGYIYGSAWVGGSDVLSVSQSKHPQELNLEHYNMGKCSVFPIDKLNKQLQKIKNNINDDHLNTRLRRGRSLGLF